MGNDTREKTNRKESQNTRIKERRDSFICYFYFLIRLNPNKIIIYSESNSCVYMFIVGCLGNGGSERGGGGEYGRKRMR